MIRTVSAHAAGQMCWTRPERVYDRPNNPPMSDRINVNAVNAANTRWRRLIRSRLVLISDPPLVVMRYLGVFAPRGWQHSRPLRPTATWNKGGSMGPTTARRRNLFGGVRYAENRPDHGIVGHCATSRAGGGDTAASTPPRSPEAGGQALEEPDRSSAGEGQRPAWSRGTSSGWSAQGTDTWRRSVATELNCNRNV